MAVKTGCWGGNASPTHSLEIRNTRDKGALLGYILHGNELTTWKYMAAVYKLVGDLHIEHVNG